MDQKACDAQQGVVGARRGQDVIERRGRKIAGRAADIQKLAHGANLSQQD
jgi:hypothetical protein